jgi:hypothetical protein
VTDAYGFSLICKEHYIGHTDLVEILVKDIREKLYLLHRRHPDGPGNEFTFPFPFTPQCIPSKLQTTTTTVLKDFCQHYGIRSIQRNADYDALWSADAREMSVEDLDSLQSRLAKAIDTSQ